MEKIALVEIGGSHDECLLTQMDAIKQSGRKVILITTQVVMDRNPFFSDYIDSLLLLSEAELKNKMKSMRKLLHFLKKEGVSKLVLNTAQGNHIRNLSILALFSKIEFIGIIHTTRKFNDSFTQKIIHKKIKKYLLLSAFLKDKITPQKGISLDYFYPIHFNKASINHEKFPKKTIVVIGGVENRRKDLEGFPQLIKNVGNDFQFVFLGKSDPNQAEVIVFKKRLIENQLSDKVIFYDHFVSNEEFSQQIQLSTAILPLVHPNTPSADQYFKNQISGAMNVAFGYHKSLLIHEEYSLIEEMQPASVYYNLENFSSILEMNKDTFIEISAQMKNNSSFDVLEQEKRYLSFILG